MMSGVVMKVAALSLLLLTTYLVPAGAQTTSRDDSRAAAAMYDEFETIVRISSRSLMSAHNGGSIRPVNLLAAPFIYLGAGLDALNPNAASELLSVSDSVVMGGKGFIPSPGSGAFAMSAYCYIVAFGRNAPADLSRYFKEFPTSSLAGGQPIWKWHTDLEYATPRKTISFYAAHVERYLVFAGSLEELRVVAHKLNAGGSTSEPLVGLREWASVSLHEYWAYRMLRSEKELKGNGGDIAHLLPGARVLILYSDADKSAVVQVFGVGNKAKIPSRLLQELPFSAKRDGALEVKLKLSAQDHSLNQLATVLARFGFTMVI